MGVFFSYLLRIQPSVETSRKQEDTMTGNELAHSGFYEYDDTYTYTPISDLEQGYISDSEPVL